jgi:hypothetical protein
MRLNADLNKMFSIAQCDGMDSFKSPASAGNELIYFFKLENPHNAMSLQGFSTKQN